MAAEAPNSQTDRVQLAPASLARSLYVPDHQLLRCIGKGSYGEVWLARNVMGTYRAVKIVFRSNFQHQRPYDREFSGIQRFEPVSRSHEGLVDILQVGRNDEAGYFYYVMELADPQGAGDFNPQLYEPKTLGRELEQCGRFAFADCLRLSLTLTSALGHLHGHNLIHRDIKPSNIIFVNGVPKLADIGLVTEVGADTIPGGTMGYMAPEGTPSPQADLYGLGKVIYEICTGKDRQEFPELPENWADGTAWEGLPELNEIVLKACEENVRERYQTAEELHADLVHLQAGKSVKRLRLLEARVALLGRVALICLVTLVLVGAGYYTVSRELQRRAEARQRHVGAAVAHGAQAMEAGDYLGALPFFAEALALDQGNRERERPHRLRIGMLLPQCPKIVQMFFGDATINHCEFSPDGHHLIMACRDGTALLWQAQPAERLLQLSGHEQEVNTARFSRDGRWLVTAGSDGTARIWTTPEGRLVTVLEHPKAVLSAEFDPTGQRVLTACADGQARLWRREGGPVVRAFAHRQAVRWATFSPDGQQIATASQDSTARIWNADTGEPIGKPLPHLNWVYHAAFSPDGRYLVTSAFEPQAAFVWEVNSGQRVLTLPHPAPVYRATFSPDGRYLLTAGWDYAARVWSLPSGDAIGPPLQHSGNVMSASFAPDGRRIVTGGTDRVARLWDLAGEIEPMTLTNLVCSADGNHHVQVIGGEIQFWNASTGETRQPFAPDGEPIESALLNRDGTKLLTLGTLTASNAPVATVAQLWDRASSRRAAAAFYITPPVRRSVLSDDGQVLVAISGGVAQIWSTLSGQPLSTPLRHGGNITEAALDRATRHLLLAVETNVFVHDLLTGHLLLTLPHRSDVAHAEFSPEGSRLVTARRDGTVEGCEAQVWALRTGKPVGEPLRHRDGVLWASFSPDGTLVVTASEDRTAQVWHASTGTRCGPAMRHRHEVASACFNDDGTQVITASRWEQNARVWQVGTSEPLTPPLAHPWGVAQAQFIGKGGRVLTRRASGDCWCIPLHEDARPVGALLLLAQFLSGHQSEPTGDVRPVNQDKLREVWETLRGQFPENFTVTPRAAAAWHEREVRRCEGDKAWGAAAFHLEQLLALNPRDGAIVERRNRARAAATEFSAHP